MKKMRLVYDEYLNILYLADLSKPKQHALCLNLNTSFSWEKDCMLKNSDFLSHNLEDDEWIIDEWMEE